MALRCAALWRSWCDASAPNPVNALAASTHSVLRELMAGVANCCVRQHQAEHSVSRLECVSLSYGESTGTLNVPSSSPSDIMQSWCCLNPFPSCEDLHQRTHSTWSSFQLPDSLGLFCDCLEGMSPEGLLHIVALRVPTASLLENSENLSEVVSSSTRSHGRGVLAERLEERKTPDLEGNPSYRCLRFGPRWLQQRCDQHIL